MKSQSGPSATFFLIGARALDVWPVAHFAKGRRPVMALARGRQNLVKG